MSTGGLLLRLRRDESVYADDSQHYVVIGSILSFLILFIGWSEGKVIAFPIALAVPPVFWLLYSADRSAFPLEIQLFEKALRLRWRRIFGGSYVEEIACDDVLSIRYEAGTPPLFSARVLCLELIGGRSVRFQLVRNDPARHRLAFEYVVEWNAADAKFAVVDGLPNHVDVFSTLLRSLCPRCVAETPRGPLW